MYGCKILHNYTYSTPLDFKNYILQNKELLWNFGSLEKKIKSLLDFQKEVEPFIIEKTWKRVSSIEIDKIVGTDHHSYIGLSYLDMLKAGIKMDINIPLLLNNPIYYYEQKEKNPTIYYAVYNLPNRKEIAFVDKDGNHRSCLAKVLRACDSRLTTIYGVTTTSHKVNFELRSYYFTLKKELEKHGYYLDIEKIEDTVNEDKNGAWIQWSYKHVFRIVGNGKNIAFSNIYDIELDKLIPKKNIFSKILSYFIK